MSEGEWGEGRTGIEVEVEAEENEGAHEGAENDAREASGGHGCRCDHDESMIIFSTASAYRESGTNVENPGAICSPVAGNGIRGRLGVRSVAEIMCVWEGNGEADGEAASGNKPGKRSAIMEDKHATMKDTTVACT